jgi:sortase A
MQRNPPGAMTDRARVEHAVVLLSSIVWTGVVLLVLVFAWGYQDVQAQWDVIEHGERSTPIAELPTPRSLRTALVPNGPPSQVLPETPLESVPLPTATARPTKPAPSPTATPTRGPSPLPATRQPTRQAPTATPTVVPTAARTPTPTAPVAEGAPTRLVIASLGIDAPVVPVTWTTIEEGNQAYSMWQVADYAAGWHSTSARPGQPGNTVIAGHHNIKGEVFRYLADIQEGALVDLYAGDAVYHYYVEQKMIVKEKGEPLAVRQENARWIDHTDDVRLTLITCWPYTNNTHRVIVVARPHA